MDAIQRGVFGPWSAKDKPVMERMAARIPGTAQNRTRRIEENARTTRNIAVVVGAAAAAVAVVKQIVANCSPRREAPNATVAAETKAKDQ